MAKVALKTCMLPKEAGGLGLLNIQLVVLKGLQQSGYLEASICRTFGLPSSI